MYRIAPNQFEDIRMIMNNNRMNNILENRNLSETFSSHPQSFLMSNK